MSAASDLHLKTKDKSYDTTKELAMDRQDPTELQLPAKRQDMTPMTMLDRAVASGANVEVIEKLMGLQERFEANQARRAFDNAMAFAKAKMPVIIKEQEKTGAGGTYRYEDLAGIARAIDPILAAEGLSYRFRTESNGIVKVTCIISHRDGHSEENSLSSSPDTSGSKNAIQAIGSAVTYLQRYTLKAALGLAASKDDDGAAAGAPATISEEQAVALDLLITKSGANRDKFFEWLGVENSLAVPLKHLARATKELNEIIAKKKAHA